MGLIAIAAGSGAQAESPPELRWNRTLNTESDVNVNGLAVDAQGNAAVVGYTAGDLFRTAIGFRDGFIASYDVGGERSWGTQIGSRFRLTYLEDVAPGPAGDWYAVGTADYRRGAMHYGQSDVIVQRVHSNGTLGAATQLGTASDDDARGVTILGDTLFVAGDTYGSLAAANAGGNDAFVAGYQIEASSLSHSWSAQKGTNDWDLVFDVAGGGNRVFVSGDTYGNFNGPNIDLTDGFVLSYDTDGNFQWARQYGQSDEPESAYAVATDGVNAVYIAGLTFLGKSWSSGGDPDAYLAKYDFEGNFIWERFYQTSVWDVHTALDLDVEGNVYVGGYTGQQSVSPTESSALVMKYTPEGDLVWKAEFDVGANERTAGLEVSPGGDQIWIAGTDWIGETDLLANGWVALLETEAKAGDFNRDGMVDHGDYSVWMEDFGSATNLAADANHDEIVDAADYIIWRRAMAGGNTNAAAHYPVPEPPLLILIFIAAWLLPICPGELRTTRKQNAGRGCHNQ
jgi:hypothetical protein